MAPSIPIVAALFAVSHAHLDESSMLQMPVAEQNLAADQTADECRCPGYYEAQCTAEAAQGCVWSAQGSSNGPWCQCLSTDIGPAVDPATVTLPPATVTLPPVEPPRPWALVLQYGDEPYTPTAEAVGVLDEQATQFAKLADAAINAIPSGGEAGFDYFKLTSDPTDGCDPNADGWDTTHNLLVRTSNVGGYDDEDRGLGLTSGDLSICSADTIEDCTSWSTVDQRSNFDTVSATTNSCSRWYSGHSGRLCNHAYGAWQHDMSRRCFNMGGSGGWRTNVKIYKLTR